MVRHLLLALEFIGRIYLIILAAILKVPYERSACPICFRNRIVYSRGYTDETDDHFCNVT